MTISGTAAVAVDPRPRGDFLVGPNGRAVLPAETACDLKAIERRAGMFAAPIEYVAGRPGRTRPGEGLVIGLGADARSPAELYAHLTSRRYAHHRDPQEVVDGPCPDVLVTTWPCLTFAVLDRLYSGNRRCAPGIICAGGSGALRRQAILAAIAGGRSPPDPGPAWTGVFPVWELDGDTAGPLRLFGKAATPQAVRAAMAAGAGVLMVNSHGDGVDVFLGKSLALCPLDRATPQADRRRASSCGASGFCHRYKRPTETLTETGLVISPDDIRARIMLLDVCYGALAGDALIDPGWGVGERLIGNDGIGALVTTWDLTLLEPRKLDGLVADLERGATLGAAVARFNRSPIARRTATRLCLFGEPRTRAAPRSKRGARAAAEPDKRRLPDQNTVDRLDEELRELAFSRACLMTFIARSNEEYGAGAPAIPPDRLEMRHSAEETLDSLVQVERRLWQPGRDAGEIRLYRDLLRRVLLKDIARRGEPWGDWMHVVRKLHWKSGHCAICGSAARIGTATLGVAGVSKRRIRSCPRCRVTGDMPVHHDIGLHFDPHRCLVSVRGAEAEADWSACLAIRGRQTCDDAFIAWPAAPSGQPAASMSLAGRLRPVPLTLAFIIICLGKVSWVSQDIHGGQLPSAPMAG